MQRDYELEIIDIIKNDLNEEEKRNALLQYHESDIAQIIPLISKEDRLKLYNILGDEETSNVFSFIDDVEEYIHELNDQEAADIIEMMDVDDAIDLLDELDESKAQSIYELMDSEAQEDIKLVNTYTEEQIGSKLTTNYICIQKDITVKAAMREVIKEAASNDNVSTIYVVDEKNIYYGILELRDLIIARDTDDLNKFIKTSYPFLYAKENISDVINDLKEASLDSMAVLNDKNELIGVITSSDIIETIDEELGEDYAKLAGLTGEEDLKEPILSSIKKRIPWLIILLFLGLIVSSLISTFEAVVVVLPAIVFFQSLILDMAGNTGTQSLAVTIRFLSGEKDNKKAISRLLFKEFAIGFFNGIILSVIGFITVFLFLFISKQSIVSDVFVVSEALKASSIVAISLLAAMSICSLIGSFMPIFFVKIKVDPAVASGPFITTINDILAVLIYYGLAYLLFIL